VLLLGVSSVNSDIPNPGSYCKRTCYCEGHRFENGNIIENKLCIVTGKILNIRMEQLQIHIIFAVSQG
jgi:hypothetical protein